MKPKTPNPLSSLLPRIYLLLLTVFCGFALALTSHAQSAASGAIHGQISNAATRGNLSGVRIQILGQGREVVSERDGFYTIAGLAPGGYTLAFEYPGLDQKEMKVDIRSGDTAQLDVALTADTYVLSTFTVAGEREGNAAAIAAQRNSVNVQNIVTSDAFGNIAKGNVGNFLKRLPGLAGTTDEVETENIILRGMAAEFTSLDIDGTRSTSGGGGRAQSAAAIPADMIERVEVVKATTPDMDADSIGGRVNLVTKSAFDRKGRAITLRAADSYSFTYGSDVGRHRNSPLAPSFSGSYADVYSVFGGQNNLGVLVSANWERILDVRGTTSWANYQTPTVANGGDGVTEYPRFDNGSTALHGIDRGGVDLRVDYKVSDSLSVGASAIYTTYTNDLYRTRNQLNSGTVRPQISDLYFVVIDGASYATERSNRHQLNDTYSTRLFGTYKNPTGWRIDGNASFSRTKRDEKTVTQTYLSTKKLDYALDRRDGIADARWPRIDVLKGFYTTTTTVDTVRPTTFINLNPFSDDFSTAASNSDGQWQRKFADNQLFKGKVDVSKIFTTRWPIEVKSGASWQSQSNDQWRDDLRGKINVATTGYGPNLTAFLDNTWDLGGAIGRYPAGYVLDIDKITQAMGISYAGPNADPIARWNYNPTFFTPNVSGTRQNTLVNTRKIWEDVYAAYVQGSIEFGKLSVLGGMRIEQTKTKRNQLLRRREFSGTLAEWTTRTTTKSDYDNTYPSLHLRYRFSHNLQAKASFSTSSAKPDWDSLLGSEDIEVATHKITVPNLDLKPRYSRNYDLSLEYYFEPVGVISVGIFQKTISNFDADATRQITPEEAVEFGVVPVPGDTTLWNVSTKANVGTGRVRGIELNYSQQLSNLLPGALRGFGIFANYTYLQAEGTFDVAITGGTPQKRDRLQNFIPRTANAGLSYVRSRVDLRLSWNYTGAFDENTQLTNIGATSVRGERWQLDFSGKYQITSHLTFFADLINLTSGYGKKYRGYVDPVYRDQTNALGFLMTTGFLANF